MKFLIDFLINGPERLSAPFAWLPPLFARIVVGWVFLWSGWGKLNALERITQNFVEWGIPFPHIIWRPPLIRASLSVNGLASA